MAQSEPANSVLRILTDRRAMLLGLMALPAAGQGIALAASKGEAQMQPELYDGQATGFDPLAAPEPVHSSQATEFGTRIAACLPW